ncbi:MAG: phage BR0599 family protein [bacterium]
MDYKDYEESQYLGSPVELYKFSQSSNQWLYTSGDEEVVYNGELYKPAVIKRSAIEQDNEMNAGSITINLPRDNELAAKYIANNPAGTVWLTVYRMHRNMNTGIVVFIGRVAYAQFKESEAIMTVSPFQANFERKVPRIIYQSICNHALYSKKCGVNKDLFKVIAELSAVDQAVLTADIIANYPDGWFRNGYILFGDYARMIVAHSGKTITVLAPVDGLSVGSKVYIYAGCDKTKESCRNKFGNMDNYLGFNYIPETNPFTAGVV